MRAPTRRGVLAGLGAGDAVLRHVAEERAGRAQENRPYTADMIT